jgi:hypothetical protein
MTLTRTADQRHPALWWEQLRHPQDPAPLPPNVVERGRWYERHVGRARVLSQATDLAILAATAGVPLAIGVGADDWVPAVLGFAAAVATGARQTFGFHQNWPAFSRARQQIESLVVDYSLGGPDFGSAEPARARLAHLVEEVASTETGSWAQRVGSARAGASPGETTR